jgi:predicted DNA-binding antitoxin AbrB/MazE fold protein
MTRTIRARFSKGVFEPLEPTVGDLVSEGEEVMLIIDPGPAPVGNPIHDTAGGWRGLLDADALKEAIYRDRLLVTSWGRCLPSTRAPFRQKIPRQAGCPRCAGGKRPGGREC